MEEKESSLSRIGQVFLAVVIFIVIIISGGLIILNNVNLKEIFSTNIINKTEKEVTVTDQGIADAVDKLYNASVLVKVYKKDSFSGWGSGFVYKTDNKYGYILTNAHVVDSVDRADIILPNDEIVDSEIIGYDVYSDVAVIRIPVDKVIEVAVIGKSDPVRIGDTVFAIGTPVDLECAFTVTRGILSGRNRLIGFTVNIDNKDTSIYINLLQIDASINSGNSGGPLANSNGEVIGINNSKVSSNAVDNIGFAIPIEDVLESAKKIEAGEKIVKPVLGVYSTDIDNAKRNNVSVSKNIKYGAVITEVAKPSAAYDAGVKAGDVVIKLNEFKIKDSNYLKYNLFKYSVGDKITLTVIRDGKEIVLDVTL